MTKAQTIARKQERQAKPGNYFAMLAQSQQAADESNARYGFRKVGR